MPCINTKILYKIIKKFQINFHFVYKESESIGTNMICVTFFMISDIKYTLLTNIVIPLILTISKSMKHVFALPTFL